jgi:hypothetical protein
MDIVYVIGLLAAFLLGAYVRKPFEREVKPTDITEPPKTDDAAARKEEKKRKQLENLLAYTGREQKHED